MKAKAALFLLLAPALPAPAIAQSAETPVLQTKWSLDQPRKKVVQRKPNAQQAEIQGPAVPAPQRVKVKRTRTAARAAPPPPNRSRVNATPLAAAVVRKQNKN